jgi:hypothetical protein
MKSLLQMRIAVLLTLVFLSQSSFAQYKLPDKSPLENKEPRNQWGFGLDYSEGGFGPMIAYYLPSGSNSDFLFKLSFSGYSDSKEIQRTDINGNVFIENKINRIYTMPLSIGWRTEPFKASLEGNFNPVFSIGIAPTLVAYNPYDQDFFSAIDNTQAKFAFGGFTGIGFSYKQSEGVSMNMNFNYYYLPVIGGGVYSVEDSEIKNVGGFQISFGVNFLN